MWRVVNAYLLALNSGDLAILDGLLSSLALLEERLGDQDLFSGGRSSVETKQTTVSPRHITDVKRRA